LDNNNFIVGTYINKKKVKDAISQFEGYAFIPDISITDNVEIDFKKLGWLK